MANRPPPFVARVIGPITDIGGGLLNNVMGGNNVNVLLGSPTGGGGKEIVIGGGGKIIIGEVPIVDGQKAKVGLAKSYFTQSVPLNLRPQIVPVSSP